MNDWRAPASHRPPHPGGPPRRRGRPFPRAAGALAAVALVAAAAVALALALGGSSPSPTLVAERYAQAWAHRDLAALYEDLDEHARAEMSFERFAAIERLDYSRATFTGATVYSASPGAVGHVSVSVGVRVRTRMFRTLYERFTLTIDGSSSAPSIRFDSAARFPGLRVGEELRRVASAPARGVLLTRHGTPLADLPSASNVIGTVGEASGAELRRIVAEGFPASTPVGLDGLEAVFQRELSGTPGGVLYAGDRLLAATAARPGLEVRTSISPTLQNLAVTELGTSLGGIVVMEPSTGEILAAAGRPLSELEPPGSTFKIITLTAVLEAHLATAHTTFADASSTVLDGFTLHNSDGETCGGTLANAFAVSCNSVFAPLGARVGSARLVAAAQSYGFNVPSPVSIASESTIPPSSLGDDLELGDSAIGQGQVLASPLQMLRVAATIALVGRRPVPTFALVGHRFFPRVIPVSVARTVRALMRDVVSYGTGTAAQIPGVIVAGKTGTAQVITPQCPPAGATAASGASGATGATGAAACSTIDTNPHDTDAWFVAFAPEIDPRVVVAVLLPNDGVGGTTAAPLARAIIAQALADG